ncbi:MAG: NfeD family protein [Thermoguttaceae bacterium]
MPSWIWTLIFCAAGIVIAVLELFVPSGGFLAFFSFTLFCVAVLFAFYENPLFGTLFSIALFVALPLLIWQLFIIWPKTPIGRRILLDPKTDPALASDPEEERRQNLIGQRGVAVSLMMPGGIVEIDNQHYDAVSEAEPIDVGSPVLVRKVNKMEIIVRPYNPNNPNERNGAENEDANKQSKDVALSTKQLVDKLAEQTEEPVVADPFQ